MTPTPAYVTDPEFLKDLESDMTGDDIAVKWDIHPTTARKWRRKFIETGELVSVKPAKTDDALRESVEESSDGSRTVTAIRDRPVTMEDARDWIRSTGDDPDDYALSIRAIAYGQDMFSNRMSATPKRRASAEVKVDWAAAAKFVEGFTYIPAKREFLVDLSVLQPTDEQWGKTDFNGGTPETEERVMGSYSAFTDYIKEFRPREVLFARTGDGIENTCSTNSQRDTNDLDVPHMLVQSYKMDLQCLKMIAPLVEKVKDARVTSNHGRWRTGLKADAGNPHADFGIAVGRQLESTQSILDVFPNVEFLFPDRLMESMAVTAGGVKIGLVHGHQASGPDRLSDWWKGQDHGRMPTWDADVLLAGHWHSFRTQQSGDGRWIMVGPASDPGSSWFSNLKGDRATSGMLAMSFEGKRWRFQEIL